MGNPLVRLMLISLLAGLGILAACGGDSELTTEEYFKRVEEISADRSADVDALDARFEQLEEDDLDGLHDLVSDLGKIARDAINDMDGLNPPSDLADAHDEFVDAGKALSDEFDKMVDELGDAETAEEAFAIMIGSGELDTVENRFDAACVALEQLGSEAGVDADLDCGDPND